MGLMPRSIGYQDLVALMARQSEVSQRARAHMMASPFGTIHAATFSFPQPVGTHDPRTAASYQLASIGAYDPETTGALARDPSGAPVPAARPRVDFPTVNRRLKGDLLVTRPHDNEAPPAEGTRDLTPGRVKTVSFPKTRRGGCQRYAAHASRRRSMRSRRCRRSAPAVHRPKAGSARRPTPRHEATRRRGSAGSISATRIGEDIGTIQPWPADEEVVIETPPAHDPDIKRTALASPLGGRFQFRDDVGAAPMRTRETMAASARQRRPARRSRPRARSPAPASGRRRPAERLNLDDKQRAKSEKCLAEAVYFESRGEVKRGQIAVAQVVMNRVFSGFYPNNVCGVVYQNAHRKLACQFTFACDGIPDVVERAGHVGAGQGDRPRHARRQAVAAGDRPLHALPRLLGASVLGERDAQALQDRRAQLLSAARLGRHRRGAEPSVRRAASAKM